MREIEQLVARLIDQERKKRLAAAERKRSAENLYAEKNPRTLSTKNRTLMELPSRPVSESAFGRLRGRLPWPVSSGALLASFGNQVHPTLGTITINKGIDIGSGAGAAVHAVADGTVSVVSFIPGFGHLVILGHDDDFYTVYAHVENVTVKSGQHVAAGETIAASGKSDAGPLVHFEIWRARTVQNPISWLAGR